jgi:hypothetical protein
MRVVSWQAEVMGAGQGGGDAKVVKGSLQLPQRVVLELGFGVRQDRRMVNSVCHAQDCDLEREPKGR